MIRYHDFNTGNNLLDDALENYLMHGYQPGGFLTAVLANDLFMAVVLSADYLNKINLGRIVREIQYKVPNIAYGNYAAVKDWCDNIAGCQSLYAEHRSEQKIIEKLQSVT